MLGAVGHLRYVHMYITVQSVLMYKGGGAVVHLVSGCSRYWVGGIAQCTVSSRPMRGSITIQSLVLGLTSSSLGMAASPWALAAGRHKLRSDPITNCHARQRMSSRPRGNGRQPFEVNRGKGSVNHARGPCISSILAASDHVPACCSEWPISGATPDKPQTIALMSRPRTVGREAEVRHVQYQPVTG